MPWEGVTRDEDSAGSAPSLSLFDLSQHTKTADPHSLVSSVTLVGDFNRFAHHNESGVNIDTGNEAARYDIPFVDIPQLVDFDVLAGDKVGWRMTIPKDSNEWDDFSIVIGIRNTDNGDILAHGILQRTTTYGVPTLLEGSNIAGTAVNITTSTRDLVFSGTFGWNKSDDVTKSVIRLEAGFESEESPQATFGLSSPNPTDVAHFVVCILMYTRSLTDNGAQTSDCRLELVHIPYPA